MRRTILLAAVLASATSAQAASVEVKIPKEGWSISFEAPQLSNKQEAKKSGGYAFAANAERFDISLFVEKPHGTGSSHRDCYNFYWPKASQNPMIAKDTVSVSETETYTRVQYDIVANFQGRSIRQKNVNYYFIFRGRWVDVHISIIDPTGEDDDVIRAFDASLKYGP